VLILAEGIVRDPLTPEFRREIEAWLGPMMDDGFLRGGYVDSAGRRVWMVLSADTHPDVIGRLGDLPVVRRGLLSFTTTAVTPVRFA
jgi:hypothetical protein